MKTWQKLLISTLIVVLIAGTYLFFVFQARKDPGVAARQPEAEKPMTDDQLAYVKAYYFATFDQAKQIEGRNVWIKAGYSLPYYPYAGNTVQFSKRVGVLPAAEKLAVSKLIKAVAPAKEDDRVPHGTRQYFAVFTFAGPSASENAKPGTFAAPIGYAEGDDEKLWTDQLFFYDDPKTIYAHWPKPVWDAITAHTPTVGMSENQVRMAVGMKMDSDSTSIGDRTVTYDTGDKKWTVTFVKNAATAVKAG